MRYLAAIVILSGAFGLTGQDAATVIRTETRVALVDTVTTDRTGNLIRDLQRKDFHVWEDGKEQTITGFSLESAGLSPERSQNRYITFFFDTTALDPAGMLATRQATQRFLDGFASPERFMAVISFVSEAQILQNFTADRLRLKHAVDQVQVSNTLGASNAPAVAMPGRGRGGAPLGPVVSSAPSTGNMLAALRSVAESLGAIRGRKAVVLFTGAADPSGDVLRELPGAIDACNKANVAVYAVDGRSLSSDMMTLTSPVNAISGRSSSQSRSFLPALAEKTGGLMFASMSDLAATLGKVAQEQDAYYLLSYTPTTDGATATCHNLTVKVDRPGVNVRARKSYCTPNAVVPVSGKAAGADLETKAAGSGAGNISARMQLPYFYAEPNVARVNLALDVIPSAMKFRKDKGVLHGEFDLVGVAYKADGSVGARFGDTVKVDFARQQEADAFMKAPYRYTNWFEIAPGKYRFRLALSTADREFGKLEMPLEIEPWSGQTLSMSGIALSHHTQPFTGLTAGLDDSLLEGAKPLISRGTEVIADGTNQFRAGERGFFYFEIYSPGNSAAGLIVNVRMLDRATGELKASAPPMSATNYIRPGNPVISIVLPLPADVLPKGSYRLEVSVSPSVTRTVDFDVN